MPPLNDAAFKIKSLGVFMDKRKIGILTFHDADNLGAVLQAYALQTVLETKFNTKTPDDVEIIDYRCDAVEKTKKVSISSLKSLVKALPMKYYYAVKHRSFERFRKNRLKLSAKYTRSDISCCANEYDIFIAGSDQVWNLECSGNDYTYFLDFASDKKKLCSYAASIGNYRFSDGEKENFSLLLKRFHSLSVREENAVELLKDMGLNSVSLHADPVMLLDKSEWFKIASKRIIKNNYVFVYMIKEDSKLLEDAKAYAKKNNLKLVCNKSSLKFIQNGSPEDFISWIYYADAIFTNSFHGTAFSLIFNKALSADIHVGDKTNTRIYDVLKTADALNCVCKFNNTAFLPENTEKTTAVLCSLKQQGTDYLERICTEY